MDIWLALGLFCHCSNPPEHHSQPFDHFYSVRRKICAQTGAGFLWIYFCNSYVHLKVHCVSYKIVAVACLALCDISCSNFPALILSIMFVRTSRIPGSPSKFIIWKGPCSFYSWALNISFQSKHRKVSSLTTLNVSGSRSLTQIIFKMRSNFVKSHLWQNVPANLSCSK